MRNFEIKKYLAFLLILVSSNSGLAQEFDSSLTRENLGRDPQIVTFQEGPYFWSEYERLLKLQGLNLPGGPWIKASDADMWVVYVGADQDLQFLPLLAQQLFPQERDTSDLYFSIYDLTIKGDGKQLSVMFFYLENLSRRSVTDSKVLDCFAAAFASYSIYFSDSNLDFQDYLTACERSEEIH